MARKFLETPSLIEYQRTSRSPFNMLMHIATLLEKSVPGHCVTLETLRTGCSLQCQPSRVKSHVISLTSSVTLDELPKVSVLRFVH